MAMENIVSRHETAISRNSDDFVPDRDGGFAEHLLQNAFNAIYHNEVYNCDWDMFWTTHPDAEKHALLRAISGGPVYFSDRIGETNPDIVSKLCLLDGRLLMLDRSACVSEDCTFSDPFSDCAIKIQNAGTCFDGRKLGVVAAFNLTENEQMVRVSASDILELEGTGAYLLYDYRRKEAEKLEKGEAKEVFLEPGDYAYFIILPLEKSDAVLSLGLSDKYVGVLALENTENKENGVVFTVKETGNFMFVSERIPTSLFVNGKNCLDKLIQAGKNVYEVILEPSNEKMMIEILL